MSSSRRNIFVGLTVLASLIALGGMLLKFGSAGAKLFRDTQEIHVTFVADRADGLSEGSPIYYRGVVVGRVTKLQQDTNQRDVLIDASIDTKVPPPANVHGIIRTASLISGNSLLAMELTPVPGSATTVPTGKLAEDQKIATLYIGSELVPPSIGQLAAELGQTAREMREAKLISHLDETIRSAGDVATSLKDMMGDPKLRDDLRVGIANFRQTTETANRAAENFERFSGKLDKMSEDAAAAITDARTLVNKTQGNIDQLSARVDDRLLQASKLLDSLQSIASKMDKGQGTAGQLMNDPKLYQSLVDSSKELNMTIADLRRLVNQWEQEGVSLKMK